MDLQVLESAIVAPNRAHPTHPIAVSMSEKVAPECTAHPDTKASRRSSLSEIADEGIRAAGSGHRSSIAGRRNSLTTAMIKPKPLGCGIKSAYSLPRLVLSGFDYTIRPARVTVYREAFGMPIMTMSMLVSICKSLDFLLGFLVGKLSDSTRTRWGRRKPWIAAFSPIFIVVTLLLASPGLFFSSTAKDAAAGASTCASHATKGALNCTALKQCLDIEIAAGSLPAWDSTGSTDGAVSASSYSTGLAVYFATLYFMHYVFGWTASMIPYDALGMELTTDYDDKTSLFGMKVRWLHRASRGAHCTVPFFLRWRLCFFLTLISVLAMLTRRPSSSSGTSCTCWLRTSSTSWRRRTSSSRCRCRASSSPRPWRSPSASRWPR